MHAQTATMSVSMSICRVHIHSPFRDRLLALFFFFWTWAVYFNLVNTSIFVRPYHRMIDGYMGSLTCAQIWVRAVVYEVGVRHKQVCTKVDSEGQKNCPSPSPTRGSNPGFSDLNSDALTIELRLPFSLWLYLRPKDPFTCTLKCQNSHSQKDKSSSVPAVSLNVTVK